MPVEQDGKLVWGVRGRLAGDWFHTSLPATQSACTPDAWPKTIAFAYAWYDRSPKISIGGTIAGPMILNIDKADTDPAQVSVASGLLAYRDTPTGPQNRAGWVLVQMLADDRIKIEYFSGDTRPLAFSSAAQEYLR